MSELTYNNRLLVEQVFIQSGYVLDFTNSSFEKFVYHSIDINIYHDAGYEDDISKGKKLKQILKDEPNLVVGKLLLDLCEYYEYTCDRSKVKHTENFEEKIMKVKEIALNLSSNASIVDLPKQKEETLQTLMEDIIGNLSKNKPELALDRLHTFSTKFLREICEKHNVTTQNNKNEYVPLHSLLGGLKKFYKENNIFQSDFTITAIGSSISIFDKYNAVRNNQSFAYDNEILNRIESQFAIKIMADTLCFIDDLEKYIVQNKSCKEDEVDDLPF